MEDIQAEHKRPVVSAPVSEDESEAEPLVLTERDISIFKLVHEQRYLAFNQIKAAFWRGRSEIANAGYKRVTRLAKAGYLEEGYSQRKSLNLYLLSEKSYAELQRRNLDRGLSRYVPTSDFETHVDHDLKVGNIRILFNQMGLVDWTSERVLKNVRHRSNRVPDGMVTIGGRHVIIEFENTLKSKQRYVEFFDGYATHSDYYLVIVVVNEHIREWLLDMNYNAEQVWFVEYNDLMEKKDQVILENKHDRFALARLI